MIWNVIEWVTVGFITSSKIAIGKKKWWGWCIAFVGYNMALVTFAHAGLWAFAVNMVFMIGLSVYYGRRWYRDRA